MSQWVQDGFSESGRKPCWPTENEDPRGSSFEADSDSSNVYALRRSFHERSPMSEPYPSGPQQPGFQPSPNGQPYSSSPGFDAPHQGGPMMPPNPYGQQPTGYPPAGYGAVQPGYGQPTGAGYPPQAAYGQPPYYAAAPKRPGAATGASVLGIISGSFGLIIGFFSVIGVTGVDLAATLLKVDNEGLYVALGYINAFGTFLTAVALLASGITFLKGKGYGVLLGAGFAQLAMVTILLVMHVMTETLALAPTILALCIGYGLAATIVFLLLSPSAKQWSK